MGLRVCVGFGIWDLGSRVYRFMENRMERTMKWEPGLGRCSTHDNAISTVETSTEAHKARC